MVVVDTFWALYFQVAFGHVSDFHPWSSWFIDAGALWPAAWHTWWDMRNSPHFSANQASQKIYHRSWMQKTTSSMTSQIQACRAYWQTVWASAGQCLCSCWDKTLWPVYVVSNMLHIMVHEYLDWVYGLTKVCVLVLCNMYGGPCV